METNELLQELVNVNRAILAQLKAMSTPQVKVPDKAAMAAEMMDLAELLVGKLNKKAGTNGA